MVYSRWQSEVPSWDSQHDAVRGTHCVKHLRAMTAHPGLSLRPGAGCMRAASKCMPDLHAGPALGTHLLVGRSVPGHPHGGVVTRVPAHGMRLAGLKKGRHVSPCEPHARPGSACECSDSYPLPCAWWVQVREISDAFDGRSTIPTAFRLVTPSRSRRVRSRPQAI